MIKEILSTNYCGINIKFELDISPDRLAKIIQRTILDEKDIEKSITIDLSSFGTKCDKNNILSICEDLSSKFKIEDETLKETFVTKLTDELIKAIQCNPNYLSEEDIKKIKSYEPLTLNLQLVHNYDIDNYEDDSFINITYFIYIYII